MRAGRCRTCSSHREKPSGPERSTTSSPRTISCTRWILAGARWVKRFDPKDVSALEAVPINIGGTAAILLSTGKRILCFALDGTELWESTLWHHPGTLTVADLDGDGADDIPATPAVSVLPRS